jgi:hypothetical protein
VTIRLLEEVHDIKMSGLLGRWIRLTSESYMYLKAWGHEGAFVKEYIIAVGSVGKCIETQKLTAVCQSSSAFSPPFQATICHHSSSPFQSTIPVHPFQSTIPVRHSSPPLRNLNGTWGCSGKEYTRAVGSIDESIGSMRCYLSLLLQSDSDPPLRSAKVESERY